MNKETQKMLMFGIIIGVLVAGYSTFMQVGLSQGFFKEGFIQQWIHTFSFALITTVPFILVAGYAVRKLVDKIFEKN